MSADNMRLGVQGGGGREWWGGEGGAGEARGLRAEIRGWGKERRAEKHEGRGKEGGARDGV
jgi:hypothetical protein